MENGKASGLPKVVHAWFFISFSSPHDSTEDERKQDLYRNCWQKGWSINIGDCSSA